MKSNLLFVLSTFLAHRFLPKYDVRMQLLMFQIKMLHDRIDDQRIVPTPEERAELLRLGNEINHDVADVMLVVKPQTYRCWLSPKAKTRSPKPAGRPGTAEDIVALILRMATENLSWGYKRIFGELKTTACEANGARAAGKSRRDATAKQGTTEAFPWDSPLSATS
jgi:putative transposase